MARTKKMPRYAQVLGLSYAMGQAKTKDALEKARLREIAARTTDTKVRTRERLIKMQATQAATKLKLAEAALAQSKTRYYDRMALEGKKIPDQLPHGQTKVLECPKCRDAVVPGVATICDVCHVKLVETVLDMKQISNRRSL